MRCAGCMCRPASLGDPPPGPVDHDDLVFCDLVIEDGKIAAGRCRRQRRGGARPRPRPLAGPARHARYPRPSRQGPYRAARPQHDGRPAGCRGRVRAGPRGALDAEDVRRASSSACRAPMPRAWCAIRTHLDSQAPQPTITFPVFKELRDAMGRPASSSSRRAICPIDTFLTGRAQQLADMVADASAAILGSGTRFVAPMSSLCRPSSKSRWSASSARRGARPRPRHACRRNRAMPSAHPDRIARMAVKRGFKGRILAGHCCCAVVQTDEFVRGDDGRLQDAGIDIVSLPAVQSLSPGPPRLGATPRWRGVTLLHELKAHGHERRDRRRQRAATRSTATATTTCWRS